jgi:serine/threonine protein kinase
MRAQVGSIFNGRFRLDERAGSGATSSVWRAVDVRTHDQVALKLFIANAENNARWRGEVAALSIVRHPCVPSLIAAGGDEADGVRTPYIAMSWTEGRSLREALRGPMSSTVVQRIGLAACDPLTALHDKGLVHRDIKPEHLIVDPALGLSQLSLIDLGITSRIHSTPSLSSDAIVGTLGYLPPEQLVDPPASVDPRWDVFSLGCVLFECATGVPPFGGRDATDALARTLVAPAPDPRSIEPSVEPPLAALINAMLSPRAAERPADAHAVCAALSALRLAPDDRASRFDVRGHLAVIVALPDATRDARATTPLLVASHESASCVDPTLLPKDARARALADGSIVVWINANQLDASLAVRAIQCALLLAQRDPAARFCVALSEGRTHGGWPAGPAFERALTLVIDAEPGSVSIDPVCARFADGAVPMSPRGGRFVVHSAIAVDCGS